MISGGVSEMIYIQANTSGISSRGVENVAEALINHKSQCRTRRIEFESPSEIECRRNTAYEPTALGRVQHFVFGFSNRK